MPILTLSTDIGQRDYIVGALKGQFLQLLPTINIVDITHYLSQTNYPLAAYTCNNAYKYYPDGTYHLILVNVFESAFDHFLIANYNNQYIICPDNGLITMIAGVKPLEIVKVPVTKNANLLTITGDLAAAVLKLEEYRTISAAGAPALEIVEKYPLKPTAGPDWIEGQILFIDNFENVVINITRQDFEEHGRGRSFKIMFKRNETIEKLSQNYAGVPEHEKMAWFNSAGYLEIALRNGNIAGLFGLQGYSEQMQKVNAAAGNKWFYQTIRVFFEN
jgi:S-adenosylmethionine hydrolase